MAASLVSESLSDNQDTSSFDCSDAALNVYLHKFARQNQLKESARTYVALEGKRVVGYYTLVFGSVSWDEAPTSLKKGLGKYPVPIILIARLAVDKSYLGKGLGTDLLQEALIRAISASEIAGLRAVIVDAKNERAKKFYLDRGFHPFAEEKMRLFVSMVELKRTKGNN